MHKLRSGFSLPQVMILVVIIGILWLHLLIQVWKHICSVQNKLRLKSFLAKFSMQKRSFSQTIKHTLIHSANWMYKWKPEGAHAVLSPSPVTTLPSPQLLKATSMTMQCWTLGQLTRIEICKTRSTISPLNKMRSLFRFITAYFFRFSFITSLLIVFLLCSGCAVNQIYYQTPSSAKALTADINTIYVDRFKGEQSVLFSKILTYQINQQTLLKSLAVIPEKDDPHAAILSVEVGRYAVHDTEEIIQQTHITLVENQVLVDNPAGLNTIKRVFEFVEKPYQERLINRTLDLEISFKIINAAGDKTLYLNTENASLKQSYRGEEDILLIPDSLDEMARLAQLLMQKFC
mgnify:CR=1 FL=1